MPTSSLAAWLTVALMLLARLFGSPAPARLDLDGLATLTLPASFHRDDSRELRWPASQRLRRLPYLAPLTLPNQLTYYLPSGDYQTMGGREVPVLLRVTLYAPDVVLSPAPDQQYFDDIAQLHYHYDGQKKAVYAQAAPAGPDLYYTEEWQVRSGWFSTKNYRLQHFILTDTAHHFRLFLSATEDQLPRLQAKKLLQAASRSLVTQPALLAQHFGYARYFLLHEQALKQANVQANLAASNKQLVAAGLPPLQLAEPYRLGRFVDTGAYFYGVNGEQEMYFSARLGYSTQPTPALPPYFSSCNPDGRYLPSVNQQAILQQLTPPAHELHLRGAVSEPLWYPPADRAPFSLPELLREAAETAAQVQRRSGYVPPPQLAPVRWELPWSYTDQPAQLGQRFDYRIFALQFDCPASAGTFQLRYLGQRTVAKEPPQLVFTLEVFDGSVRYRAVAADARYFAVGAAQGGHLEFDVAGTRYQASVAPLADGHLLVEPS